MTPAKQENLDHKPGFWITVLLILPFILAVEIASRMEGR